MRTIHGINLIIYIGYTLIILTSLITYLFDLPNDILYYALLTHIAIGISQPLLALFTLFFLKALSNRNKKKFRIYWILTITDLILLYMLSEFKFGNDGIMAAFSEIAITLLAMPIPFFIAGYFTHILYSVNKYDIIKKKPLL